MNSKLSTPYRTQLRVRVTDLNYGNHLAHDKMVSLLHEARVSFFKDLGYADGEIHIEEKNLGIVVKKLSVDYKKQVKMHELLSFEITVGEFSDASFVMSYVVKNETEVIAARASTKIVFINYETGKISKIPVKFLEKTRSFEQD